MEIQELLSFMEASERFTESLEQEMITHLAQVPYSNILLSLKGIGEVTAAGLIGEVGDFRKFRTMSEIMKLAGLDLFEVSSGRHKGQRHISKRGRPLMRKLLYFAALNTVKQGGAMHQWYRSACDRGMPKPKAWWLLAERFSEFSLPLCVIIASTYPTTQKYSVISRRLRK